MLRVPLSCISLVLLVACANSGVPSEIPGETNRKDSRTEAALEEDAPPPLVATVEAEPGTPAPLAEGERAEEALAGIIGVIDANDDISSALADCHDCSDAGGRGLVGTGGGGGGTGEGTIGLGNYGTIGQGGGGGAGQGYGRGSNSGTKVPRVTQAKADVTGALDKDIIRRIVRAHISEVRHCYNETLKTDPDAQGRVMVQFIIAKTGKVRTSAVKEKSMRESSTGACIAKAVERWVFPKPQGGGEVKVSYPFVLVPG